MSGLTFKKVVICDIDRMKLHVQHCAGDGIGRIYPYRKDCKIYKDDTSRTKLHENIEVGIVYTLALQDNVVYYLLKHDEGEPIKLIEPRDNKFTPVVHAGAELMHSTTYNNLTVLHVHDGVAFIEYDITPTISPPDRFQLIHDLSILVPRRTSEEILIEEAIKLVDATSDTSAEGYIANLIKAGYRKQE